MKKAVISEGLLTNIANAIRSKTEESGLLTPAQMAEEISGLNTQGYDIKKVADGNVHLWLDITAEKNLYMRVNISVTSGTVTVNWGDGQSDSYSGGTQYADHTYASLGFYRIDIVKSEGAEAHLVHTASYGLFATGGSATMRSNLIAIDSGNWDIYGYNTFAGCSSLRYAYLSGSYFMQNSGVAIFNSCGAIVVLELAERWGAMKTIGNGFLVGGKSLDEFTIPDDVVSIGSQGFQNCGDMTIYAKPTTPPSVSAANAFSNTFPTIYVPYSEDHSVLAAYKSADIWSTFADSIFEESQT